MMILYALAYFYAFFLGYVITMGAYRAKLQGRLVGMPLVLLSPVIIVAVLLDLVCQYTLSTLLFWDFPASKEWMVTMRLQRYVADKTGWRYAAASYICERLLDIFDPRGEHC